MVEEISIDGYYFLIFGKNNYFCKDIVISKRFLNKT